MLKCELNAMRLISIIVYLYVYSDYAILIKN